MFGNLRCGAWYVNAEHSGQCHFKSTDGHQGNWDFSLKRLNLEVALKAAWCPTIVVDATRKGKAYPVSCLATTDSKIAIRDGTPVLLKQTSFAFLIARAARVFY